MQDLRNPSLINFTERVGIADIEADDDEARTMIVHASGAGE